MIKSKATPQFWKSFRALPPDIQRQAQSAYRTFKKDPSYPGLDFKKLAGTKDLYSVRVGIHYRAIGRFSQAQVIWFFIGGHDEYDRLT